MDSLQFQLGFNLHFYGIWTCIWHVCLLLRFGLHEKRHWGDYFAILSRTSLWLICPRSISATRWKPRKRRLTPGQKKHEKAAAEATDFMILWKLDEILDTRQGNTNRCFPAVFHVQKLSGSTDQQCNFEGSLKPLCDTGLSESTRSSSGFAEASSWWTQKISRDWWP